MPATYPTPDPLDALSAKWLGLVTEILQGQLSVEALRTGLTREVPGEKKFMLKAQQVALDTTEVAKLRPQLKATVASMASARARKACRTLDRYCAWYDTLIDPLDGRVNRQSWQWADAFLAENPDQAVTLVTEWCDAQGKLAMLMRAMNVGRDRHGAKAQRREDPLYRAANNVCLALLPVVTTNPTESVLEAELLVLEKLCGGVRPLLKLALAMMYNWMYVYCLAVVFTLTEEVDELYDGVYAKIIESAFEPKASVFRSFDILAFDLVEAPDCGPHVDSWKRMLTMMLDAAMSLDSVFKDLDTREREAKTLEKTQAREIIDLRKRLEKATTPEGLNTKLKEQAQQIAKLEARLAAEMTKSAHLERQVERMAAGAAPEPEPPPAPPTPKAVDPVPDPKTSYSEDLAWLVDQRVALIGGHPTFIGKVKSLLPAWSVFPATCKTLVDAEVPAVTAILCFTQHCGHPLFDAAVRIARNRGIPVRYVKKVNPTAFVQEAAQQLRLT